MWNAPDFRVPYNLEVLPIFDHAHLIIIKLTLAFLNLYQHAKKSAHVFDHNYPKTDIPTWFFENLGQKIESACLIMPQTMIVWRKNI